MDLEGQTIRLPLPPPQFINDSLHGVTVAAATDAAFSISDVDGMKPGMEDLLRKKEGGEDLFR